jgi:cytosine/adenosine deaminase-related metal-dependent hydrolase
MGDVTPGMVCGHHHLYSSLARGMPAPPVEPRTFLEILQQVWWRLDVALDLGMIRAAARLGALEALESGTTAIVDHHESPSAIEGSLDVIADACREVGVRAICAYGVTDRHGPDGARRGLEENERFLRAGGRGMVGVHAAFTCSDATLAGAAGLAAELHVGAHIHVAEGLVDANAGQRLAGLAADDWLLAHGVHLDRQLPGTLAHNARSNMNNSVGYANPAAWPGRVVLGTDGIGADMLEEFRLAHARAREADVTSDPGRSWAWVEAGCGGLTTGWTTRGGWPSPLACAPRTSGSVRSRSCAPAGLPGWTPSKCAGTRPSRRRVSSLVCEVQNVPRRALSALGPQAVGP